MDRWLRRPHGEEMGPLDSCYISNFISDFINLDALFAFWTAFIASHRFGFHLVYLSIGWNLPPSAFCKAGFVDSLFGFGVFLDCRIYFLYFHWLFFRRFLY
ncbi:hypothetical protein STEG23_022176 [Scotinomys teguina]